MTAVDELQAQSAASGAGASLLDALVIVARYRGLHLSAPQLRRDHLIGREGPSLDQLLQMARANRMRVATARFSFDKLMRLGAALPAILLLKNGSAMVLLRTEDKAQPPHVVLQDPTAGEHTLLTLDEQRLSLGWCGDVILLKRDHRLSDEDQPFGLGLIFAQLLRDRRIARDIAVAAIVLSFLTLGSIIFWRLLIDRVVYYRSFSTLAVLCVGDAGADRLRDRIRIYAPLSRDSCDRTRRRKLVGVYVRQGTQSSTRFFRAFIDRRDHSRYERDVEDPQFFDGAAVRHGPRQLRAGGHVANNVLLQRHIDGSGVGFLRGHLPLDHVVLPMLRRRGALVFRAEGAKNAFLVETLQGIRTVKSLALDARQRHEWDVRVATAARLRLDELRTANVIQTVVTPLERLMVTGVFALGVYLAIATNDQLYIGALIAFMMLTQRMAAPLI